MSFAARLLAGTERLGPLCVGLDPYPARIPAMFGAGVAGITAFCRAVIAQAAGQVTVLKPQAALFEAHGPEGFAALATIMAEARAAGLLVILDAKRGDIGDTAAGYAQAYLGQTAPMPADCLTVAPYMGADSIAPFVAAAKANGRGVAVLARTSNPGSADLQALVAAGEPVFAHTARMLAPFAADLADGAFSSLMIVAGATGPAEARLLRSLLPTAMFLVPGYGAQGASAAEAVAGFVRGPDGRLTGGVVNASRSVLYPAAAQAAPTGAEWERAIREAIAAAQGDLTAACAQP
jgi:orotidine-5'-phosphate decarboxylase